MTRRFGIDTSILVRLVTGDPEQDFVRCVGGLRALIDRDHAGLVASNQVIGETYIALQHHYGLSKADARADLRDALRSGLVVPLNGRAVFTILDAGGGGRSAGPPDCRRLRPRQSRGPDARPEDGGSVRRPTALRRRTQPRTEARALERTDGQPQEVTCQDGNYSLDNILRGSRALDGTPRRRSPSPGRAGTASHPVGGAGRIHSALAPPRQFSPATAPRAPPRPGPRSGC